MLDWGDTEIRDVLNLKIEDKNKFWVYEKCLKTIYIVTDATEIKKV